ncbi:MAG: glycerol-3-phosphate dehydrogenase/oxidase [Promethearchaeia archaeon]
MPEIEDKLFDMSWNYENRETILKNLKNTDYDIIVIGGGITGAGVAREAVMRDLKVALVEMQDFAAGTSSRSSKLAHGGIRYLANLEFGLVREATTERNWLLHDLPHIIRPIPFLFIDWENGKESKFEIKLATTLYDILSDWFSKYNNYKKHKWYSPEKVFEFEPEIKKEGNQGGAIYWDNNMDDGRIVIETLKEAVVRGADVVNYCEVTNHLKENGKVQGVECKDHESGETFEIKGKVVVNATGIWTDDLLESYPEDVPKPIMRPTKGVHLIYERDKVKNNMATIIRSITDDRAFFVLPRGDYTIIGTTDTDYNKELAQPFCTKEDADYLIKSVKYYFPTAELGYENLISTYAGIRPLVMQKGKSESDVSRKHEIFWSPDGLLTITGGKYTTFRKMAEDLMEEIEDKEIFPDLKVKKNVSKKRFLVSLEKEEWFKHLKASPFQLDEEISNHLYQQYGRGALKILEMIKDDKSLKKRIDPDNNFIKGEIIYILRHELTLHLMDVFRVRTEMSLFVHHEKAKKIAEAVADIMAEEYGWTEERKNEEIATYMDYVKKTVAFI